MKRSTTSESTKKKLNPFVTIILIDADTNNGFVPQPPIHSIFDALVKKLRTKQKMSPFEKELHLKHTKQKQYLGCYNVDDILKNNQVKSKSCRSKHMMI